MFVLGFFILSYRCDEVAKGGFDGERAATLDSNLSDLQGGETT